MQRELNEMHQKLDKFESKEDRLSNQLNSMNSVIKDVKMIEDNLVNKEQQLEQKIEETKQNDADNWGADHINMHPLMPHFSPPKDVQKALK